VVRLAIYIAAGGIPVIYRPAEAGRAFRTGGALGFAGFVHRTLLVDGLSRLLGRTPPPSPEQATAELQQVIGRLETELAARCEHRWPANTRGRSTHSFTHRTWEVITAQGCCTSAKNTSGGDAAHRPVSSVRSHGRGTDTTII
jgi:hypothetical protein